MRSLHDLSRNRNLCWVEYLPWRAELQRHSHVFTGWIHLHRLQYLPGIVHLRGNGDLSRIAHLRARGDMRWLGDLRGHFDLPRHLHGQRDLP